MVSPFLKNLHMPRIKKNINTISTFSQKTAINPTKMGNLCTSPNVKKQITSNTKLLILVVGGPCSGKSTQSRILSNHFQLTYISPDQIIRDCLTQESLRKPQARLERLRRRKLRTYNALLVHNKMTKEAKEFLGKDAMIDTNSHNRFSLHRPSDSEEDYLDCPPLIRDIQKSLKVGQPIPPHIITIMVHNVMRQLLRNCNGFVIDGYPRDARQAELFSELIGDPHLIVFLDCPDTIMVDRVLHRAKLSQRFDDNEPFTKMKINSFHKHLAVLTNQWKEKNIPILRVSCTENSVSVGKECTDLVHKEISGNFKISRFRYWEKIAVDEHPAKSGDDGAVQEKT